jgi:hypothetical protein
MEYRSEEVNIENNMKYDVKDYIPSVSTMTIIFRLDTRINELFLYYLLNWGDLEFEETTGIKIYSEPFSIKGFDNRFLGIRGNYKRKNKKQRDKKYTKQSFKNGISVQFNHQSFSAKITSETIHMTGPKSFDIAIQSADSILKKIRYSQNIIDKIKKDVNTIDWILKYTKGTPYKVIRGTSELYKEKVSNNHKVISISENYNKIRQNTIKGKSKINKNIKNVNVDYEIAHSIKIPEEIITKNYPDNIDIEIADFILLRVMDYRKYEDFRNHIEMIRKIDKIMDDIVAVTGYGSALVNQHFYLGFRVNRTLFTKEISGFDGVTCIYRKEIGGPVRVCLPYVIPSYLKPEIALNSETEKTFTITINLSGACMISGPHKEMNRQAYYYFRFIVSKIEDKIKTKNQEGNIKPHTNKLINDENDRFQYMYDVISKGNQIYYQKWYPHELINREQKQFQNWMKHNIS